MNIRSPIIRENRILAAIRFRDGVTGEAIRTPVTLGSDALRFRRNRSGMYAVSGLRASNATEEQLAAHLAAFAEAPAQPAADSASFDITASDPAGRYLPRIFQVALTRGDVWDEPVTVDLHPAPNAPTGPNWSGIRASLMRDDNGTSVPLSGARVRLLRASDQTLLGTGYADERGEVLAVAPGIPVIDFTTPTNNGNGGANANAGVGTSTTQATIEIHTDAGRSWPPNPAAIDANGQSWAPTQGALPQPELRTGRLETAGLSLLLQPQP